MSGGDVPLPDARTRGCVRDCAYPLVGPRGVGNALDDSRGWNVNG